jgi:hypothetical protein
LERVALIFQRVGSPTKSRISKSQTLKIPQKNIKALIIISSSSNTEPNIILLKFPGNVTSSLKIILCEIESVFLILFSSKIQSLTKIYTFLKPDFYCTLLKGNLFIVSEFSFKILSFAGF